MQAQIRENIKALRHCPLWREFTGDRWLPRTKGQQRGTCFHLMTSSWFYSLLLQAVDVGGSMFVHVFGAYFGIAMGAVMAKNDDVEEQDHKAASVYHADLISMIGEGCFHVLLRHVTPKINWQFKTQFRILLRMSENVAKYMCILRILWAWLWKRQVCSVYFIYMAVNVASVFSVLYLHGRERGKCIQRILCTWLWTRQVYSA